MADVGFLGLGIMGYPMAQHLIEAGHKVALWSHNASKAEQLAHRFPDVGATAYATPAEVAQHSDCTFLCVGDTAMVKQVVLGPDGLAKNARAGSVIVDCSTIAPSASRAIGQSLEALSVDFLDAPCTGSKAGAEKGQLTFMVGGKRDVFDRVKPYFEAMGTVFYYCGEAGMGLHAKLSQNMILGNLLQAFNESFVLATKAGVDPEILLDILNNSAARTGLVSIKAPMVFKRDFSTNFSVKWLAKDMQLMLESAAELDVPTPVTALSQQMFLTAIARGFGEDDICGSIRVLEEVTNTIVRPPTPLAS